MVELEGWNAHRGDQVGVGERLKGHHLFEAFYHITEAQHQLSHSPYSRIK